MAEFRLNLKSTVSMWPPHAEQNIADLGEGWRLADKMADLHSLALQRISRAAGRNPERQDEGVLLLGTHGLNLFIATMGLIAKGQFDVVSHLLRAGFDCQSLAFAVGSRADLAEKFFAGDLRSAECRKLVVVTIRAVDSELADFIDSRYRDEFDAANELSHVSLTHVDKILDRQGDTLTPIVGGRIDADLARNMAGVALENEYWHLVWFKAFRSSTLGQDWVDELSAIQGPFRGWMKEVFGATGYNADTDSYNETKER